MWEIIGMSSWRPMMSWLLSEGLFSKSNPHLEVVRVCQIASARISVSLTSNALVKMKHSDALRSWGFVLILEACLS